MSNVNENCCGTFQQLMISEDSTIITEKQKNFKDLHNEIVFYGQTAADNFVNFCLKLKQMKESGLYTEAGFKTFDDYTEKACNIKGRQAYNYLSVVEKLPQEYVRANAHIGVSKLALIASLTPNERDELEKEVDVKDISSRELAEKIEAIKSEYQLKLEEKDQKIKSRDEIIEDLKKVKVNVNDKEVKKAQAAAETAKKETDKAKADLEKAKAAAEDLKKKLEEVQKTNQEDDEKDQKIIELEAQLKAKIEECTISENKIKVLSNDAVGRFVIFFENLKVAAAKVTECLDDMGPNDKKKFSNALKAAYLKSAESIIVVED